MKSFDAIGGYFGLHTNNQTPYYPNLLALNSGRNALEYILLARKYKKVYLPFYSCEVLLEPLRKHSIEYDFYHIDFNLEPVELPEFKLNHALLYINYFGLKTEFIGKLKGKVQNLVLDYAQAFFTPPLPGVDTFYSPRKFFGIPDGGYVSINTVYKDSLERDLSAARFSHLLIREEQGAEAGYEAFKKAEASIVGAPIKVMSKLTEGLLATIDYEAAREKRNTNFAFLHQHLKEYNTLNWFQGLQVNGPMVYPFFSSDDKLRNFLIEKKVFSATYWPNVLAWTHETSVEYQLTKNIIFLPVDQRYEEEDMRFIVDLIFNYNGI